MPKPTACGKWVGRRLFDCSPMLSSRGGERAHSYARLRPSPMSPSDKGRRGEQEIGRILYKAWFGSEPPKERTVFIRTGFGRKQPYGDLITPADFPYIVEVKNTNYNLQSLNVKTIKTFVEGKARLPVAVFIKLGGRWFVIVIDKSEPPNEFFHLHTDEWNATIYPLDAFLKHIQVYKASSGHDKEAQN